MRFQLFAAIVVILMLIGGAGMAAQELGYLEEVLGVWDVKYPGRDGMINEAYVERLELRCDGTYSWNPAPPWAPRTGKWGILKTQDRELRLCFEEKQGRLRCNYLVLMQLEKGGPFFLNWQRTRGDAVIFADRIFRADRPKTGAPKR